MKIICITGIGRTYLDAIGGILQSSGVDVARTLDHASVPDLPNWHERLLAQSSKGNEDAGIRDPGRLWEQLATDLFLGNIDSKVWYWSDLNSLWLLDFWLGFDPNIHFVLPTLSPVEYLMERIRQRHTEFSPRTAIEQWLSTHQRMLRFHLRHPDRTLLPRADDCLRSPQWLVERCNEHWSLSLETAVEPASEYLARDADPLARYFVEQILANVPEVRDFEQELAASVQGLEDPDLPAACSDESLDLFQAFQAFQAFLDRQNEIRQLHDDVAALRGLLATQETESKQRLASSDARFAQMEKEKAALTNERDEAMNRAKSQQQRIDALSKEKSESDQRLTKTETELRALEKEQTDIREENELLLLQLHQVQEELESIFLNAQSATTAHAAEKDEFTKRLASSDAQLAQQESQFHALQEENTLLSQQLHQVQEELERYFHMHQEARQAFETVNGRWLRVLQRNPLYCDADRIEILPDPEHDGGALAWHMHSLSIAGRFIDRFDVSTLTHDEGMTLIIVRDASQGVPLKRWPIAADTAELHLAFGSRAPVDPLLDLAPSDWMLVHGILRLMGEMLAAPDAQARIPNYVSLEFLRNAVSDFAAGMTSLPAVLRYEDIRLEREQINADYEHLWIRLGSLEYRGQCWSGFEFRLSCADVRPEAFGTHPKLEFPESAEPSPLVHWFKESIDDFGPKLEVRFALPDAIDIDVLSRFETGEISFISALIERLPSMLACLERSGVDLTRSWDDWRSLVSNIQSIWDRQVVSNPEWQGASEISETPSEAPLADASSTQTPGPIPASERSAAQTREPNANVLRFWT